MTIVIDIPEDIYTRLFDNGIQDNEIAVDDICEMARALRMGTPLDDVKAEIIDYNDKHCNSEFISVGTVFEIIDKHIGRK